jgi:hypothetical protein
MKEINHLIKEKNIIILSPHYDDVPLTFGGFLDGLAKQGIIVSKDIRIIHVFSRSNYQARDDQGNKDISLKRIQYATGIRLLEDLNCLDELLGHGNYHYEIKGENECGVRQKLWKPGEKFEFPHGTRDDFDGEDWGIYENIKRYASDWLNQEDTAILLPLGVKEHFDHIILREAVLDAWKDLKNQAKGVIYLGEDQPYTGLASDQDWETARDFLEGFNVEIIDYPIDESRKTALIWKHYPTQVEESYRTGVIHRALQLKKINKTDTGVERMYRIIRKVK